MKRLFIVAGLVILGGCGEGPCIGNSARLKYLEAIENKSDRIHVRIAEAKAWRERYCDEVPED